MGFDGLKAGDIYDGVVVNGLKHLDAISGWRLSATCFWVKTGRLSNRVS
jgi:hypothetical protein